MIQTLAVGVIVAAAAAWLVWSFAPAGLRRWIRLPRPRHDGDVVVMSTPDCACGEADDGCKAPGLPLHAEELGG